MPSPSLLEAATAQVQLFNESIRISPGNCSCGFGLKWTMYFSTLYTENPAVANGEIAPLPQPAARSHWSYLVLEDPSTVVSAVPAEFDVPLSGDADQNGTADFFEVTQEVSAGSTGTYPVIWPPYVGQLEFQWTRAAGSRQGTCLLYMNDPVLGRMGPYTHAFELISYAGDLNYTRGSNHVAGTIQLTQTGGGLLAGPISFTRSWEGAATNRFNRLTASSLTWTNEAETFSFAECELKRDLSHPNTYRAALQNPGGSFASWQLSLVDANDANGNGIPDLSDDLVVAPPRRPVLALSRMPTHLLLSVSGDIGRHHVIQAATNPNAPDWTNVQSLSLTNDPHQVILPLPPSSPTFWRVQAQ